jgi:hypothetical protein
MIEGKGEKRTIPQEISPRELAAIHERVSAVAKPLTNRERKTLNSGPQPHIYHRRWLEEHAFGNPDRGKQGTVLDDEKFVELDEFRVSDKAALLKKVSKHHGKPLYYPDGIFEGSDSIIMVDAPDEKDTTTFTKVRAITTSKEFEEQLGKVNEIYSRIWPDNVVSVKPWWIDKKTSGIDMQAITPHPLYKKALSAAKQNDNSLLKAITTNPFENVLADCIEHKIPLSWDLNARNFITDIEKNQKLVDELYVEPSEITPKVTLGFYNLMERKGTPRPDKVVVWKNIRDIERYNYQQVRKK